MKTKVYEYKGVIGIESDWKAEGLLNDPSTPGQLGFVLDASKVEVSKEALELLRQVPVGHDSLGDVDCFAADDGMTIFAWLGGPLRAVDPADCEAARNSKWDLLEKVATVVDNNPAENFKQYIDVGQFQDEDEDLDDEEE